MELKKKTVEYESDGDTYCYSYSWYSHRGIIKGTGGPRNMRTRGNNTIYYVIEICQNIAKSLETWGILFSLKL